MLLDIKSYYSLRYGTMSIAELVQGMLADGYDTAVLTDLNSLTRLLEFLKACREQGLNGLAGMEFCNGEELLYVAISKSSESFRQINDHMSATNRDKVLLADTAPCFNDVFVVYPYGKFYIQQILSLNG